MVLINAYKTKKLFSSPHEFENISIRTKSATADLAVKECSVYGLS